MPELATQAGPVRLPGATMCSGPMVAALPQDNRAKGSRKRSLDVYRGLDGIVSRPCSPTNCPGETQMMRLCFAVLDPDDVSFLVAFSRPIPTGTCLEWTVGGLQRSCLLCNGWCLTDLEKRLKKVKAAVTESE